jgi:hypothetical protein
VLSKCMIRAVAEFYTRATFYNPANKNFIKQVIVGNGFSRHCLTFVFFWHVTKFCLVKIYRLEANLLHSVSEETNCATVLFVFPKFR